MEIYAITSARGNDLSDFEINKELKELGIPQETIEEGETAIKDYAFQNNINLEVLQPKEEDLKRNGLKGSSASIKEDYQAQLESLGIPTTVITKGSEAITAYAEKKGISVPNAPKTGTTLNLQY